MALSFRFVNNMLNVAYLTGFVRKPVNGKHFFLQQNNNPEHAIEILVKKDFTIPREFTPVTVTCHVRGARTKDLSAEGGLPPQQTCEIHCVDIERPSTRAMPASATWVMGGGRDGDDFKPYNENGTLRPGLAEQTETADGELSATEAIIRGMIDATKGRMDGRMRSISNAVLVSGLVDAMSYIPGNEHQTHGYGLIWLRQHQDSALNIPVRLVNSRVRSIMRSISEGHPIKVAGRLRRKVILSKDGASILGHTVTVETDDLFRAVFKEDILTTPEWWGDIVQRLRERKRAAQEQDTTNSKGPVSLAPEAATANSIDEL